MYEDAACNNPCGMEPMGCVTCAEIGRGTSYVDEYDAYLDWRESAWDDRCEHGYFFDDCEECNEEEE